MAWGPDGSLAFACEVDGLDEIVWWVLGYGPHAEVLAPEELRERVRDLVADTCRRYSPDPSRHNGAGAPELQAAGGPGRKAPRLR